MNQVRAQLDAVLAELKAIEQQAEGTSVEKKLSKQTTILAEAVSDLLARFDVVEKRVIHPDPPPLRSASPPNPAASAVYLRVAGAINSIVRDAKVFLAIPWSRRRLAMGPYSKSRWGLTPCPRTPCPRG
jgi:hypothetical protein